MSPVQVLLVEDNSGDALLLIEMLADRADVSLTHARTLGEGVQRAAEQAFDVLLLDLSLPDSMGLESVQRAVQAMPHVPLVVLTGLGDEELALAALHAGAQDYLVKGHADAGSIRRATRYAIERKRTQEALRQANEQLEQRVRERTAELQEALSDLRKEAEQRLAAEEHRRQAQRAVLEATEQEQQRIGRDLHDSIQGSLAGISMMLQTLQRRVTCETSSFDATFQEIIHLVNQTLQQTRGLARSLCPVDLAGKGLPRALEQLAKTTTSLFRVPCEWVPGELTALPDAATASHLYYISHEAVNNALKHARARKIAIRLESHGAELRLAIEDDGVGLSAARGDGGMGLQTMQYRAEVIGAALHIRPRDGAGTRVECSLPMATPGAPGDGTPC